MKRVISAAAALFSMQSAATQAVPVAFDFTATVYDVRLGSIALGDIITGTIRYNTELAQAGPITWPTYHEYVFNGPGTMSVTVQSKTYIESIELVAVLDDYHPLPNYYLDRFSVATGGTADPTSGEWMQLWLDSSEHSTQSSFLTSTDLLTTAPNLNLAEQSNPNPVVFHHFDLEFSARIMSFVNGRPLPEPASLGLLAFWLVGIGATYRRSV
ncbi:MAG: hypothetical protein ACM3W7_05560 [Acidobacteriota bacterium]